MNVLQSAEVDSNALRKMLNEISLQLSVTYVKKRALSGGHKQSVKEELIDAISYLSDKERELQVSLDIAKHLLDSNEDLQIKVRKLKENEYFMQNEIKQLMGEIKNFQEILKEKNEKYENATEVLINTENQLMRLSVEKERKFVREKSSDSLLDYEGSDNSFGEFQYFFLTEIEKHNKAYTELEKQKLKLAGEKENIEKKLNISKIQYDSLCSKHKNTVDRLKDLEKSHKIVLETNEKLKKKLDQLKGVKEKLLGKIEKMEEELKIFENSQKTKTSESVPNSNSLFSELQMIQDTEESVKGVNQEFEEDFFGDNFRNPERRFSYSPDAKMLKFVFGLEIEHCFGLGVPSQLKQLRKDPDEEYFILATLAVKTNSPYMDTICVIPHAILYAKVKRENVPFHQWHIWIEKQLNYEYIQSLYKKKSNLQRFKNFLKKF